MGERGPCYCANHGDCHYECREPTTSVVQGGDMDIVEELRLLESGAQWACGQTAKTLRDAADEVERLRTALRRIAKGDFCALHMSSPPICVRAYEARLVVGEGCHD